VRRISSPGAAHQQLDGAVANDDSATQPQLGVHSARAVGPAGVLVDLDDEIGQPGMADRRADGGRQCQA
jgi:hypothetical protein